MVTLAEVVCDGCSRCMCPDWPLRTPWPFQDTHPSVGCYRQRFAPVNDDRLSVNMGLVLAVGTGIASWEAGWKKGVVHRGVADLRRGSEKGLMAGSTNGAPGRGRESKEPLLFRRGGRSIAGSLCRS